MKISFVIPSRNNLKYLKWAYDSIRKNQGKHEVYICAADDASDDGTWEWMQDRMEEDDHFAAIRNDTNERLGHTILYDRIIKQLVNTDIAMIYHADMYLAPNALDAIELNISKGTIVSLTRIEPPLHQDGKEKILRNFGIEPEEFNEEGFLEFLRQLEQRPMEDTVGVFAPWAFYVQDFMEVHGHDPLYKPQSKEDSDIFNKFDLIGYNFIQTWSGFVYHMTSRGSRFNPHLTSVGKNSQEWEEQNRKSHRNFIRKWGTRVFHDEYLKPIVHPKYRMQLMLRNVESFAGDLYNFIGSMEPFYTKIIIRNEYKYMQDIIDSYIKNEQPNTLYILENKFDIVSHSEYNKMINLNTDGVCDIAIDLDMKLMNQQDMVNLGNMPVILKENGYENGTFATGHLQIVIRQLRGYQRENLKKENNIEIKRGI